MITVSEIMATEVVTIQITENIKQARDIMSQRNIRHLPVVDQGNKPVGVVTQRDILRSCASHVMDTDSDENESTIPVSMIMSKRVISVHPQDSLRSAGLQLQKYKYGCLPVVDEEKLVGIITDTDFVGVAINLIEQLDHVEESEF